MITHILHIIKRNKVTSLLLFLLFSATSLVTVLSVGGMIDKMQYFFLPRGYLMKNVSILYAGAKNKGQATDSIRNVELYNRLKASPYVEKIACGTPNLIYNYNRYDIVGYNGTVFSVYPRGGDEAMADLMGIKMSYGRWLQPSDYNLNGVVVTLETANLLFNEENVVGNSFSFQEKKLTVVGVCKSIRQSKQANFSPSFFSYEEPGGAFTVRTKENEERAFVSSLENILASVYGQSNYNLYYETIEHQDVSKNQYIYLDLVQFISSRLFMLLVALLSFIAVIWYVVEHRKQEWSIRYAMGRTKPQLMGYVFLENLVLFVTGFIFSILILFIIRRFGVDLFDEKLTLPTIIITIALMLLFLWIGVLIPSRKIKRLNVSELLKSE